MHSFLPVAFFRCSTFLSLFPAPSILDAENYDRRVLPADFNEPITIIPSSVLNGREFYAQLATQHNSFSLLHIQLNSKARITKHKKIPPTESIGMYFYSGFPVFHFFHSGEIKIVCIFSADVGKYVLTLLDDGKFYRTKVIDYAGNRKITVSIFLMVLFLVLKHTS